MIRYTCPPDQRADCFGIEVALSGQLWVAQQRGQWFAMQAPDGHAVLPVWPTRADVDACFPRDLAGDDFVPLGVTLADFLSKNLPALERQNCRVLVFPDASGNGNVFDAAGFARFFQRLSERESG